MNREAENADASRLLREVFATMAEGFMLFAADGRIVDVNAAAEAILGLPRSDLVSRNLLDPPWQALRDDGSVLPSDEHPAVTSLKSGVKVRGRILGIRTAAPGVRWISVNCSPLDEAQCPGSGGAVATFADITEQRAAMARLNEARADLQAILDNVPARISAWNADLTNRFTNRAAARQFGLAESDCRGRYAWEIVGADRHEESKSYVTRALAGERQMREAVDRQPDGSVRYSQVTYVPMNSDGEVRGFYVLGIDVTDLHNSYSRIRELARRLDHVREDERRSNALLLHEGIAQDLFGIQLALKSLEARTRDRADVAEACIGLTRSVDQCLQSVRQIANDLRPPGLAHLQLSAAVVEHARIVSARSGLRIAVRELATFPTLDEDTRLAFYRAVQEALTNVARHGGASLVEILLGANSEQLTVEVADDGIGIDDAALKKPGALGLLGMRERFEAMGGRVTVRRISPRGTTLIVSLPRPTHAR